MAVLALGLAGCTSFRTLFDTPDAHLRRAVAGVPGVSATAAVVPVAASSTDEAWERVVRARTEEPLEESELLGRAFDATAEKPGQIVVGGPYAKLVDQVLRDAFSLARVEHLSGLSLVQVSPEPPSAALVAVCAERGAACSHRRWSAGDL